LTNTTANNNNNNNNNNNSKTNTDSTISSSKPIINVSLCLAVKINVHSIIINIIFIIPL